MAIDKAIEYKMQGGVKNYRPSKMVKAPVTAKSSPDTPTAHLAYITPEEQDILIDLNLYGSLNGKPNRGPSGIPSLEGDFGGPGGYGGYQGGGGGRQDNDVSGSRDRGTGDYRVTDRAVQDAYNKNRAIREANERAVDKLAGRDPRLSGGIQTNRGPMGRMGGIFGSILGMMMGIPGLGLLTGGFDKLKGGLGSLNETLRDFREKTTGFRTQKEYEDARTQRQLQGRLDDMYAAKSKGKGFSQKNIDMIEAMGFQPSTAQNVLTGRDLKGFTPSRTGLQTIDRPTQTFSFDNSGMTKETDNYTDADFTNEYGYPMTAGLLSNIGIRPTMGIKNTPIGPVPTGDVGFNTSGRLGNLSATIDAIDALKGESVNPAFNYSGTFDNTLLGGQTNVFGNYSDDVQNIGLNFNNDKGLSGGISYDAITGEPRFDIGFRRTFADGGLASMFTRRG